MKIPLINVSLNIFGPVSNVELLAFTKHISLMIKSGIALPEALVIIEKQTKNNSFKKLLFQIRNNIENGQPFYKSLGKFPQVFDAFYVNLVRIAEETGSFEKNLDYLAIHLQKQHEFRDKVRGALMYPSVILGLAGIIGLGLSIFVLPKLLDLFSSLNVALPLSTRLLLGFAHIMKNYGFLIVLGFIFCFILFLYALKNDSFRFRWNSFVLSLPILGTFFQNIELASIFRNLGTMLEVGVPISIAFDSQIETTTNLVYKSILVRIREGIGKGNSIEAVLNDKDTRFMPLIALRMIGVGEKTGRLEETLVYLGDYLEGEVDDSTKNIATILEPMVLILVGLFVAFIAFSIISPIYQLTSSARQ